MRFRSLELLLLLLVIGAISLGFLSLHWGRDTPLRPGLLWPAGLLGALMLGLHGLFTLSSRPPDQMLLPLAALLSGLGLLLAYRLGGADLLLRQSTWLVLGCAALVAILYTPQALFLLKRYQYTWGALGLILVGLTFLLGHGPEAGGPRLWLALGSLSFQPSELLKLLLILFFAGYLTDYRPLLQRRSPRWGGVALPALPYLLPLGAMGGLSLALLVAQQDLGAAFLLFGTFTLLLYLAIGRASYLLGGVLLFLAATFLAHRWLEVVQQRLSIWIDPWSQATGGGYQLVQGFIALASGGLLGRGLDQGLPQLLPAAHTDLVFIVLAEELGAAGATAVLAFQFLLVARGLRIARDAPSYYLQLLAAGSSLTLGLQTVVILGGNLGLLPLTGVPLPFLSYGGSGLVTNFALLGLLLLASRPLSFSKLSPPQEAFQMPSRPVS